MGEASLLAADAPPWAAPLYGFELVLDPSPRTAAPLRAAAHDTCRRIGSRAAATRLVCGSGPWRGAAPASRRRAAGAGERSRATTAARSCLRRPGAWRFGSPSGRRTGRSATRRWTSARPGCSRHWPRIWRCGAATPGLPARESDVTYTYERPDLGAERARRVAAPHDGGAGRLAPADPRRRPSCRRRGPAVGSSRARAPRARGSGSASWRTENQALRQRIEAAKERLRMLSARLWPSSSSTAEGTRRERRPRTPSG